MVAHITAVAVHIGRHHCNRGRQVFLHPTDEVIERVRFATLRTGKDVLTRFYFFDRMVDVHRAAGFIGNGFRHEGGKAVVAQCGFADQAFEVEHLVGQFHRVAVLEVDLKLTCAAFLGDAVDLEPLGFGKVVDVVDHRAEFVNCGHRIGLTCRSRATRAAHHRPDCLCGVEVASDEIEFHLGLNNGFPPLLAIEFHHTFQNVAGRVFDRVALAVVGVVDHL